MILLLIIHFATFRRLKEKLSDPSSNYPEAQGVFSRNDSFFKASWYSVLQAAD